MTTSWNIHGLGLTRLYIEVYNNLYCCRLTQAHSDNDIDELGFKTTAATLDRVCFKCLKRMAFKNVGIGFPISLRYILLLCHYAAKAM